MTAIGVDAHAPRLRFAGSVLALAFDVALVLVFSGLGRAEHGRERTLDGLFDTSWPFLTGLIISWGWAMVWRDPTAVLRSGVPVWLGTLCFGMLLRGAAGQGIAIPFILVSALALGVFLIGWRAIVVLVRRLWRQRHETSDATA